MCDSYISESCPMDFTNYCPVDSVGSEGRYKRPTDKTQSKNHIAWFSRKMKGMSKDASPYKRGRDTFTQEKNVYDSHCCSSHHSPSHACLGSFVSNSPTSSFIRNSSNHVRSSSFANCSPSHGRFSTFTSNSPNHGKSFSSNCSPKHAKYSNSSPHQAHVWYDSGESSSDEDSNPAKSIGRSLSKASSYVSQEELHALKGCVMRRRAVFSPSPSSSPVHSYIQQKPQDSPTVYGFLPAQRHYAEGISHIRQNSLEYDHLKDFDPIESDSNVADSVSVQFRLPGNGDCSGDMCNKPCSQSTSEKTKQRGKSPPISLRRMDEYEGNLPSVSSYHMGSVSERCLTGMHSVEFATNSVEALKQGKVVEVSLPPWNSKSVPQHSSPLHSRFNSPLLRQRHQMYACNSSIGGLKACDAGSNYSLFSQGTTVSSLSDRQHCSYSKGVDGNLFKSRTDSVLSWFAEFSDQQRNMMLLKLLEQCDCAQMHFLSVQMEPVLHEGCPHNCQDLLSWLPFNIVTLIFSFLDPVSLCQAGAVSKDWYHAALQTSLWKAFCRLEKWKLSVSGELKYQSKFLTVDGSIRWKQLFAEKYRLRRNWLKGYCTVRTFEGHTQGISCIQFDDTRIVSGSWDKTIKVWNRRTNTVWAALTLAGHSGTVRCLHLHNNRLVSGSSDRTIKVWDLATDKVGWVGAACRATMVGHMHTVRCLQADDEKVVSGSYDQTLKVWDIKTGQCLRTLRGHVDAVLCLQFDGQKVVSGSKDKTIKIWSLPEGTCKLTFHGHEAAVSCLHFDSTRIISGALDRLIKIWNLNTGECIRTIDWIRSEGHTGVIRHLQADSWKIISAADDKTLKVWNVHTGNRLLTLKSHTDGVTCLQFNDEVIVSGSYDKTVKLWDFSSC